MAEFNPNFLKNADVGWTGTNGRYFPPDFDPSKLIPQKVLKGKQPPRQMNMRMLMPFSMYCEQCGECMYVGTKFNSKCEPVKGEDYLGIRVYRFYGKCKNCLHEFIFKTSPQLSDYVLEAGGSRSYEAHRDADVAELEINASEEKERAEDQMKALEKKTYDIREEMQRMDQLDDLIKINKRAKGSDAATIALEIWHKQLDEKALAASPAPSDLDDEDQDELDQFLAAKETKKNEESLAPEVTGTAALLASVDAQQAASAASAKAARKPTLVVKKRARPKEPEPAPPKALKGDDAKPADDASEKTASVGGEGAGLGLGLLGSYDSDSA